MRLEKDLHTNETWMVHDEMELKMGFLAQCVEKLAEKEGQNYLEVFERLENADMTEGYILKHYNTLHTESIENIIDTLATLLHQKEKAK